MSGSPPRPPAREPLEKCLRCGHSRSPHGCSVYVGPKGRNKLCPCPGFKGAGNARLDASVKLFASLGINLLEHLAGRVGEHLILRGHFDLSDGNRLRFTSSSDHELVPLVSQLDVMRGALERLLARIDDVQSRTSQDENRTVQIEYPFPWTTEDEAVVEAARAALRA